MLDTIKLKTCIPTGKYWKSTKGFVTIAHPFDPFFHDLIIPNLI